uniref:substrate-binding domain-containing protein n=1 Tax=Nonomuraea bangladeshensis TaxID=404385 RepID=UPI003F49AA3B
MVKGPGRRQIGAARAPCVRPSTPGTSVCRPACSSRAIFRDAEPAAAGAPEPLAVETGFTRTGGYEAARRLVERGFEDVEAVFAVNDVMAIGAMTALRDAGVLPGRDLGVAGFDDIDSAMDVRPARRPG